MAIVESWFKDNHGNMASAGLGEAHPHEVLSHFTNRESDLVVSRVSLVDPVEGVTVWARVDMDNAERV